MPEMIEMHSGGVFRAPRPRPCPECGFTPSNRSGLVMLRDTEWVVQGWVETKRNEDDEQGSG